MDEQKRTEQDGDEVEGHRKTFLVTEGEPEQAGDETDESDVEAHLMRKPPTSY